MCVRFALSRKGCRGFLRVVGRGPRRGWVFLGVGVCWRDNNIFIRGWLFAAFRAISIVEWAFSAVPRFVENVPFGRVCFDWSKVRNVHNNKILEYLYPMKTDSTNTCTINYSLRTNRLYIQKISLPNKLVKQTAKIKHSLWPCSCHSCSLLLSKPKSSFLPTLPLLGSKKVKLTEKGEITITRILSNNNAPDIRDRSGPGGFEERSRGCKHEDDRRRLWARENTIGGFCFVLQVTSPHFRFANQSNE